MASVCVKINGEPATDASLGQGQEQEDGIVVRVTGLRRIKSAQKLTVDTAMECRVLVLHTGGTIGMMQNADQALEPMPNALVDNIRCFPELHDVEYARERLAPTDHKTLVLPDVGEKCRVLYSVWEYDPLLDSSNMTMDDWMHIAKDVQESYEDFDGFVILHGTDTLAYTASALSFMLENLGKPVVVTGSQIPIFEARSDGRDNFLGALIIAGNYIIPEVTVFFGNKLFRGNRTTKISSGDFNAFNSLNFRPLVTVGLHFEVDYKAIFRPYLIEKFQVHTTLNRNVGLLRLFPSITIATVRAFLQPPIEGVVLQTYGAGNIPSNREDIIAELAAAIDRGVIIVNCTQCGQGRVSDTLYQTGKTLHDLGVTAGSDMTPEAALAKLSYVLSKDEWDISTKRQMMQNNLRGELSPEQNGPIQHWDLVDAVASSLHVSSDQEINHLKEILYPAILCSMVTSEELSKLKAYIKQGADLLSYNADYRTPLHVACSEGKLKAVELFLLHGASVHMKDRFDNTPLLNAIEFDRHDVIKMLIECGAHITGSSTLLGEKLCSAGARGHIKRLESYHLAKADLNQADLGGRTALHMAAFHGKEECVYFLLDIGVNPHIKDIRGETPQDLAQVMNHNNIAQLLGTKAQQCKCSGTKTGLLLNVI